ncbi:50S ribosomal protein L9 [Psittacicella melopsittaci]|uniref:Large ribosomal subunit protein bL9 n=1 Tax=Psittacicella melopsittaci TaxID=2028576 RepID=A0A3A1Y949_9GAMM|nr:50S ribosomal protein L9 [Psittacicella melopsittaci]RIY34071.1 50S ribosomal protein L9 [Psittacicella melopsittaci]
MKVILLDKVAHLGSVGTEVEVKSGYARNYLLPKHIAVLATAENRAKFEAQRAELEKEAAAKLAAAQATAAKIEEIGTLEIGVQAGSEGRLFGSVTTRDIADVLEAYGVNVEKSQVRINGGSIRELGEQEVVIHLHADVNVKLAVNVVSR